MAWSIVPNSGCWLVCASEARPRARTCQTAVVEGDQARVWSWAASAVEAEERRRDAHALVGERIRGVRYYTLDYQRHELHPELIDGGPRLIDAESEWDEPTWLFEGFDAMDYGLEVTTDSGTAFSLTWDLPGEREGIGLQRIPMLGSGVSRDADVAIWDVGGRTVSWRPMVGTRVTGVDLHYVPWDEARGSLWCPHITFHAEGGAVEVVMADSWDRKLVPSANNVAVLHPGRELPPWCS
jgi:hypothetical protein